MQESADSEAEKSLVGTPQEDFRLLSGHDAIVVTDGAFGWDKMDLPLLQEINMTVPREKFTIVVGPVGCGKSTLLKAILGEVPTLQGSIQISFSDIAFCDQTPWHMNGTVQESIIGVSPFEEAWYSTVVYACALNEDFLQLSKGDQTPIGSKGISLSGGQSQRIVRLIILVSSPTFRLTCFQALARALYARKDIVVLDDALSGLDADTENRVFHNLLGRQGLLRKYNITVLMASSSGKL